mgnify:FL=1
MADTKAAGMTAKDVEDLLLAAKKADHNFVMMRTKEGVVLEASKVKSCEGLVTACKAKGGQAAMMVQGILRAEPKLFHMHTEAEDVPRALPRLAKRFFKSIGVKAKVLVHLPGGITLDDEDESEGGDEAATGADDGALSPEEAAAEAQKAELTERLKAMVPQVRAASEQGLAGADKLVEAAKAAGTELAGGGLEQAAKLIDAIEAGLAKLAGAAGVDPAALKEKLLQEYNDLKAKLPALAGQVAGPMKAKLDALAKMFETEIERDLKKASQALSLLKQLAAAELAKIGQAVGEIAGRIGDAIGGVVEGVRNVVGDAVESVTTGKEEQDELAMLRALGVPREERASLLAEWKADPAKARAYEAKLIEDAKVPEDRRADLTKLRETDPVAFAEAIRALREIGAKGNADTSPAAMQAALEKAEAARLEMEQRAGELAVEQAALNEARDKSAEAAAATAAAKSGVAAADRAVADLAASVPDPAALTPEDRAAFDAQMQALEAAREAARKALADAEAAEAAARAEQADRQNDTDQAAAAHGAAKGTFDAAQAEAEPAEAMKGLLDAVSFGPLSPGAKPALSDDEKAQMIGLFGKDARLASDAMEVMRGAEDPGMVARNAGFIGSKFADGFADKDGNGLALSDDDRRTMATNALKSGAQRGEEYFRGFDEYLQSGKQLQPDPHGGMADPLDDEDAETQRRNAVFLGRSQAMAGAALKDDGSVDFGSPGAKDAMDHMLFHPGSLKTYAPQMTEKMEQTKALFTDPATAAQAQQRIKDTGLPPDDAAHGAAARTLIAGTVGAPDNADLTDNDARAAVLGAMMTPLSQGPVGSCFSTAPVRAIRETDPMRAMDEYAKIASTGEFVAADGIAYPANTKLPEGETPLMRSFEYSVATAAADERSSRERSNLRSGLWDANGPGRSLNDVRGIVGDAAWNDSNDPATGAIVPGVRQKLRSAVNSKLKFEYNAGPPVGAGPAGGGGGDGRSTDGRYEILYNGAALRDQAAFVDAITAIALEASGFAAGSVEGDAIVALVSGQDFIDSVVAAGGPDGYLPWELEEGGFETQTLKALNGGNPAETPMIAAAGTPPPTMAARSEAVLSAIIANQGAMNGDMHQIGTTGDNAMHAFNALPNHPSADKIKPPDTAGKIQSELKDPGAAIAASKIPADKAARMFRDQLKDFMRGKPADDRALIMEAMKRAPDAEMTPAELKQRVADEMAAWRTQSAQRALDAWFPERNAYLASQGLPVMPANTKQGYLNWFETEEQKKLDASLDTQLMREFKPPEVVIADTNWGGSENQIYFVVAPDPSTGDLTMWEKTMPDGTMKPLGKNWADSMWGVTN